MVSSMVVNDKKETGNFWPKLDISRFPNAGLDNMVRCFWNNLMDLIRRFLYVISFSAAEKKVLDLLSFYL